MDKRTLDRKKYDLELLYEFTSQLGPLPDYLLKESSGAVMYYNKRLTRLRGYKEIKINSVIIHCNPIADREADM